MMDQDANIIDIQYDVTPPDEIRKAHVTTDPEDNIIQVQYEPVNWSTKWWHDAKARLKRTREVEAEKDQRMAKAARLIAELDPAAGTTKAARLMAALVDQHEGETRTTAWERWHPKLTEPTNVVRHDHRDAFKGDESPIQNTCDRHAVRTKQHEEVLSNTELQQRLQVTAHTASFGLLRYYLGREPPLGSWARTIRNHLDSDEAPPGRIDSLEMAPALARTLLYIFVATDEGPADIMDRETYDILDMKTWHDSTFDPYGRALSRMTFPNQHVARTCREWWIFNKWHVREPYLTIQDLVFRTKTFSAHALLRHMTDRRDRDVYAIYGTRDSTPPGRDYHRISPGQWGSWPSEVLARILNKVFVMAYYQWTQYTEFDALSLNTWFAEDPGSCQRRLAGLALKYQHAARTCKTWWRFNENHMKSQYRHIRDSETTTRDLDFYPAYVRVNLKPKPLWPLGAIAAMDSEESDEDQSRAPRDDVTQPDAFMGDTSPVQNTRDRHASNAPRFDTSGDDTTSHPSGSCCGLGTVANAGSVTLAVPNLVRHGHRNSPQGDKSPIGNTCDRHAATHIPTPTKSE